MWHAGGTMRTTQFMRIRLFIFLAMSAVAGTTAPYSALRDGEYFRYRAGWGIFSHAGQIMVSARYEGAPTPETVRLSMITSTRGLVQALYRYEDRSDAEIDAPTGRIRRINTRSTGGDQPIEACVTFDYAARIALYRDSGNAKRNRDIPIPAGEPLDLLSALIQTRDWDLNPGDRRDAVVYAGRAIYPVTIHAERLETIPTLLGKMETLVLVPRMEKTAPFGMFRHGGEIKVWLSRDANRLPVKMTLHLRFGTATLLLEEHGVRRGDTAAPPEVVNRSASAPRP